MVNNKDQELEQESSDNIKNLSEEGLQDTETAAPVFDEKKEEDEIGRLTNELEIQKEKYIRLFAEFDNYKRRNARENIEMRQTAGKEVLLSMLEVMDDCDRAEKQLQASDDLPQLKEGVKLVFNKLRTTLQSKGLIPMECLHSDFDTEKHEAIAEVQVSEKKLKGKVVDEIVKGYYLNDKLIRFAKVVVGK